MNRLTATLNTLRQLFGTMLLVIALCCFLLLAIHLYQRQRQSRLPPGPPGDPILGHVRTLRRARDKQELYFEWSKQYGIIFDHLRTLTLC